MCAEFTTLEPHSVRELVVGVTLWWHTHAHKLSAKRISCWCSFCGCRAWETHSGEEHWAGTKSVVRDPGSCFPISTVARPKGHTQMHFHLCTTRSPRISNAKRRKGLVHHGCSLGNNTAIILPNNKSVIAWEYTSTTWPTSISCKYFKREEGKSAQHVTLSLALY